MVTIQGPARGLRALLAHTKSVRCVATVTSTFRAQDMQLELVPEAERLPKPNPEELGFGQHFTDHMMSVTWNRERGWDKPLIHPVRELKLHPAAKVLHYATQCFEGTKAYRRTTDGRIQLFRPDLNMKRFVESAERSVLPTFDQGEMTECLKRLVSVDQEWVPYHPSSSLYLRPVFIATEPSLGVTWSNDALLYVLAGPAGPYYKGGFVPISLLADPKYVRAPKGGVGSYKMASNYAPTIYIQIEAMQKHNCHQVLWLHGEDQLITEIGTMNFFIYWINEQGEKELITPTLDSGLILPGVTRQSIVELARSYNEFKMTEREYYMSELIKGLKENRVLEVFGAGTACIVCPVEKMIYDGVTYEIPTMKNNAPITSRINKRLMDIQFGRVPSDWCVLVD